MGLEIRQRLLLAAWEGFSLARNDTIVPGRIEKGLEKRHPNPEDISKITYSDAVLQVRGVWNKHRMVKGFTSVV